jgi:hypothetical protein
LSAAVRTSELDTRRLSSEAIADAIEADLNTFRGPVSVLDEVTVAVVKLHASE